MRRRLPTSSSSTRWTVIDQAISSSSSLLLVLTVARASDRAAFGGFSLAYILYALGLGAGRAAGGEVLLIRAREQPETGDDQRRLVGLAVVTATIVGVPIVAACFATGNFDGALPAIAIAFPILLAQDALRYCFFAGGNARGAAANDSIWLGAQLLGTAALLGLDATPGPALIVLVWGSGAALALGVGLRSLRFIPTLQKTSQWFTADGSRVLTFMLDFLLMSGALQLSLYVVALAGTIEDVGALRGGLLLYAPLEMLVAAVRITSIPRLASSLKSGPGLVSRARGVSVTFVAVSAAWVVVLLAVPDRLGRAVLGDTWRSASHLIPALAVAVIGRYVALPALDGIRVQGGGGQLIRLRATATLTTLSAALAGTVIDGARGAATGLAAAYILEAVLWWWGFNRRRVRATPALAR